MAKDMETNNRISSVSTEVYYNNDNSVSDDGDFTAPSTAPANWGKITRKQRSGWLKIGGSVSTSLNLQILEGIDDLLTLQINFLDRKRLPGFSPSPSPDNEIVQTINQLWDLRSKFGGDNTGEVGLDVNQIGILQEIIVNNAKKSRVEEMENGSNNSNIGSSSETDSEWDITAINKKRRCSDHTGLLNKTVKKKNRVMKLKKVSELIGSKGCVYECKECKLIFTDFRALGGHIASHNRKLRSVSDMEDSKGSYICNICEEVFDDFRALGGHIASHNRKKRAEEAASAAALVPEISGDGGESSSLVTESVDNRREKSYVCDICSKSFSTGQALGGHKTYHRKLADNSEEVERSYSQVISSAQKPVFEFDLNAIPMEDSWS